MDHFAGTTALVTGASSGLGAEFARQLAARGCALVLAARSEHKLESLAQQLRSEHGIQVTVFAADLAELAGIDALGAQLEQAGLHVDHLVNNAGVGSVGALSGSEAQSQRRMLVLNMLAPAVLTRHLLPHMLQQRRGGVLNVASAVALYPVPYMANYAASKAFVLSHTRALAEEVSGTGLHVTALCPGPVLSGFQQAAGYEIGGLERLALVPAAQVVRSALQAYERNQLICIPGLLNKLQTLLPRFVPLSLGARIVGAVMRKLGRA